MLITPRDAETAKNFLHAKVAKVKFGLQNVDAFYDDFATPPFLLITPRDAETAKNFLHAEVSKVKFGLQNVDECLSGGQAGS